MRFELLLYIIGRNPIRSVVRSVNPSLNNSRAIESFSIACIEQFLMKKKLVRIKS